MFKSGRIRGMKYMMQLQWARIMRDSHSCSQFLREYVLHNGNRLFRTTERVNYPASDIPEVGQIIFILEHTLPHFARHATQIVRRVVEIWCDDNSCFIARSHWYPVVGDFRQFDRTVKENLEARTVCWRAVIVVCVGIQDDGKAQVTARSFCENITHTHTSDDWLWWIYFVVRKLEQMHLPTPGRG